MQTRATVETASWLARFDFAGHGFEERILVLQLNYSLYGVRFPFVLCMDCYRNVTGTEGSFWSHWALQGERSNVAVNSLGVEDLVSAWSRSFMFT